MTASEGTKRISFEVPEAMYSAIKALGKRKKLSITTIAKMVLWNHLETEFPEYKEIAQELMSQEKETINA